MERNGIIAAALASAILLAAIASATLSSGKAPLPVSFTVMNSTYRFSAYAVTQQQQQQGLMNQTVTNSTFMLFVFTSPGIYPFWMHDTPDSLDMIWLDANPNGTATVSYIVNSAQPCMGAPPSCAIYAPNASANYVIEAKAGFAASRGIAIGTVLRLNP